MSSVNQGCTSHSFACECREARFARMEEALREILAGRELCDSLDAVCNLDGALRKARAVLLSPGQAAGNAP